MPLRLLEVAPTPNPNAMKFVVDTPLSDATLSFLNPPSAAGHPLAAALFAIPGVTSIMILNDFITVNKAPKTTWARLQKQIEKVLAEQ